MGAALEPHAADRELRVQAAQDMQARYRRDAGVLAYEAVVRNATDGVRWFAERRACG